NRLRDALPPRGERAGPASPTASGCRRSLDSGQPIQLGRSPPGLGAVTDRIVAAEPCRADELRVEFERRRIDRRDGAQTPGALLPRAERVGEAGTRLAPTSFGSRGGQALEHCACTGRGREIEVAVANLNLLDDVGTQGSCCRRAGGEKCEQDCAARKSEGFHEQAPYERWGVADEIRRDANLIRRAALGGLRVPPLSEGDV